MRAHVLKLTCPDAVGLLARITGIIAKAGGNLLDVGQYTDPLAGWFFARLAFVGEGIDWVHFDTFAWRPAAKPGRPKGGEALGLRAAWGLLAERFG